MPDEWVILGLAGSLDQRISIIQTKAELYQQVEHSVARTKFILS